ncbi:hypothetical protein [Roseovarius litorisediminis]|nr:hypothetical protein [Roseovarius litorisediminis]
MSLALGTSAVSAQDAFEVEGKRGSITPYLWGLSVDGDASVGPITTSVDIPFSDIFDKLNFALMVEGEYWNGRWGLLGNLLHSNLETSRSGLLSTTTDIRMTMLGAAVAYRFGPFENANNRTVFDAYAGLRHTKLDVRLTTGLGATASRDVNFTDPVIGGRLITELGPKSRFVIGGDIGGFGVGSDFSWQAIGIYARDISLGQTPATLFLGYRALGQDYTTGGTIPLTIDAIYHGPVIALSFAF